MADNSLITSQVGSIPSAVSNLGTNAVATYQAGLSTLSTGAAGFSTTTLSNLAASTGVNVGQITGLATGSIGGLATTATSAITAATQGDVGALLANGSKFGPSLTAAWASGSNTLSSLSSADLSGAASTALTNAQGAAGAALTNAQGAAKAALSGATGAAMGLLGKASQFATSLSDQLTGLVSGVQKAPAFTNTVDRATVDAAVTRVIGSDKIASPSFELPSVSSLGISADIAQAKSLLSQAQTAGAGLLAQAQGAFNSAQQSVGSLVGTVSTQATNAAKNLFR